MMAGKWLTRLCTTGTECPDDRPDDSRWAMALLLGLPFLSLLFCIGLWLILRWRIPLRVLGMRRPICTKKYHCYSHVTVICSLSVFYYAFVCTVCFHYTSVEVFSLGFLLLFSLSKSFYAAFVQSCFDCRIFSFHFPIFFLLLVFTLIIFQFIVSLWGFLFSSLLFFFDLNQQDFI